MSQVTGKKKPVKKDQGAAGDRIRPALQARSQATRRRILEAVDKLVQEGRFESASIADITRASGCSVGAFYGRFSDKDAVLLSFYSQRCDELERQVIIVLDEDETAPLQTILSQLIEVLLAHSIKYREFLLAFQSRFTSGDTEFVERSRQMNWRLIDALAKALKVRESQFNHPNPEIAAVFTLAIIGGLTRDAILHGAGLVGKKVSSMNFAEELERAVVGYLQCR